MPRRRRPAVEPAGGLPRHRQPGMNRAGVGQPPGGVRQQHVVEAHAGQRHLVEDALAHRRRQAIRRRRRRHGHRRGDDGERRAGTGQRGGGQQLSGVGVEARQGAIEDLTDHAAAVRGTQQLPHEQRVAARPGVELDGVGRRGALRRGESAHRLDVEPAERHESGEPSERVEPRHARLVVAARRHERDGRLAECPRQVLEHPHRHRIGPVEVLEHHHGRRRRGSARRPTTRGAPSDAPRPGASDR